MCRPAGARAPAPYPRELVRVRQVRDRIDRDGVLPLDIAALAEDAGIPAGELVPEFTRAYGMPPAAYARARGLERDAARPRHDGAA